MIQATMTAYRIALSILMFTCTVLAAQAQINISGFIRDAGDNEALAGVTVAVSSIHVGTSSNENGYFQLEVPVLDSVTLIFNLVGYRRSSLTIRPAQAHFPLDIRLAAEAELEEITISTTRTNSRIEDLPVKVEVLGTEELDEEATLVPGGMGSLLGDLSIITIQRTGAISGNDAVRMQGLAPGYTQLLQDGLPLYGGFSGSLGILSIPPLDLRQVEIIKGSSSTLYGGGAIGGLVNFLSKTPGNEPKRILLLNQTTLGETNADAFISQKISETRGLTFLAAGTLKPARDINNDGFAEVARTKQWLLHPRFFWGMGKKTNGNLGISYSQNQLRGGDEEAIKNDAATTLHPFFQKETTRRFTANGQVSAPVFSNATWTLRSAGSVFQRGGLYAGLEFEGRQLNSYLETNVVLKRTSDDWVFGVNLADEQFQLKKSTPQVSFGNFGATTWGIFLQNDHRFSQKWALQTGFRWDDNVRYGTFAMPRLSLLFKPISALSARLGYGRGYKTPDLFAATEPVDFTKLRPLAADIRADVANSLNADLNYRKLLWGAVTMQVNQAFYFVSLARPFELVTDASDRIALQNISGTGRVAGTDTYIQMEYKALELYMGYNHTLSERIFSDGSRQNEPFNPQDKIAFTAAWSIPEKWRFGIETAFSGNQFVADNERKPSYWFWAGMVAREFHWGSLVLNCENLGDARQSRQEALVTGSPQHPIFTPIWGAIEGRVVNFSVKVDW